MPGPAVAGPNSRLFRLPEPAPAPKKLFNCSSCYITCRGYVTEVWGTTCPYCGSQMVMESKIVGSSQPQPVAAQGAAERGAGFVQGRMVTDDIVNSPMSNVSSIALINACAVRDLGSLQERTVHNGYKEGLEFLKASLQSKTLLTDVFLCKNLKQPATMNYGRGTNASFSNGRRPESLAWRAWAIELASSGR